MAGFVLVLSAVETWTRVKKGDFVDSSVFSIFYVFKIKSLNRYFSFFFLKKNFLSPASKTVCYVDFQNNNILFGRIWHLFVQIYKYFWIKLQAGLDILWTQEVLLLEKYVLTVPMYS